MNMSVYSWLMIRLNEEKNVLLQKCVTQKKEGPHGFMVQQRGYSPRFDSWPWTTCCLSSPYVAAIPPEHLLL